MTTREKTIQVTAIAAGLHAFHLDGGDVCLECAPLPSLAEHYPEPRYGAASYADLEDAAWPPAGKWTVGQLYAEHADGFPCPISGNMGLSLGPAVDKVYTAAGLHTVGVRA